MSTNCTQEVGTKRTRGRVQNGSEAEYKTNQLKQGQTIVDITNTASPNNNQSKNIYINNNQSTEELSSKLTVKENSNFLTDEEKYQSLKSKISKWNLKEARLNELINEHGINNVFYCNRYLEKKGNNGFAINNHAGLLITTLPNYDCTEELKEELKLLEIASNKLLLEEKNLRYLEIFRCIEPTKIQITDWNKDLAYFSNDLLSKFFISCKSPEDRIEKHFKDIGIVSGDKKKLMLAQIKNWITLEDDKFANILKNLKALILVKHLENLLLEAFDNNPDIETKNLIVDFISNFKKN